MLLKTELYFGERQSTQTVPKPWLSHNNLGQLFLLCFIPLFLVYVTGVGRKHNSLLPQ